MNKKTYSELHDEITEQIETAKSRKALFHFLMEELKKFEGKVINKRIETMLKKAMPTYMFHMEKKDYLNFQELYFWGGSLPYEKRLSIRLNENNKTTLSMDFIRENHKHMYFLEPDRIRQMEDSLGHLGNWVNKRDAIQAEEDKLMAEMKEFDCQHLFSGR